MNHESLAALLHHDRSRDDEAATAILRMLTSDRTESVARCRADGGESVTGQ